jgi:hypothetical protein
LHTRHELRQKKQELHQIKEALRAAKGRAEFAEHRKRKKRVQQETFELERKLRAIEEGRAEGEPITGALPDFAIIGGKKCGTTFLYHLLSQHPLIEPAAAKELRFFDVLFNEGIEWYKQCFPAPRWVDGHRTITGEATPYMPRRLAPERMAQVVPEARLIALLRNPVERAYSDYQQMVRKGWENQTFEEAIGFKGTTEAEKAQQLSEGGETLGGRDDTGDLDDDSGYLSMGVYVDQLMRWREFFPREQMLVLKSEDLFERPVDTLKFTFGFLGLPEWEPATRQLGHKRRKGNYEQQMDPSTRRRLEEYFEPHNRRLYEFLGRDFEW